MKERRYAEHGSQDEDDEIVKDYHQAVKIQLLENYAYLSVSDVGKR